VLTGEWKCKFKISKWKIIKNYLGATVASDRVELPNMMVVPKVVYLHIFPVCHVVVST